MSSDTTQTATVIKGAPTKYVKLNVGGSLHYVTLGTLTKQDNMLRAMFSGRMEVLTDTEGILYRLDSHLINTYHYCEKGVTTTF